MASFAQVQRHLWRGIALFTFVVALAATLRFVPLFADEKKSVAPNVKTREPWTTSRVVGSPDPPPPFKVIRAFPELKFKEPILMVREPVTDRFVVGEANGVLYSFKNVTDAKADVFLDLRKELKTLALLPGAKEVEALYGLAFHPHFETNRHCYVCYVLRGPKRLPEGTRVSRFTVTKSDPPRIDPASEEIILTFLGGGHNGGDLHFGPDGMLYISTGDGAGPNPPDPLNTGQDISDLLSSILRIDVDRTDSGKRYAIPKDNPFISMKDARPEVWAYGFRNPWRMSFDRKTGDLFVGDVGWELWEMVHRVEKGGNYGWSAMEGPQPIKPNKIGPTAIRPALIELPHTIACSITGGVVYRGKRFPELVGSYVFGDWETRKLWAARIDGDQVKEMPEITRPSVRIVAFGEDKEGEIYFLDHEGGTIHTLDRNDAVAKNQAFPRSLSETGLFANVRDHTPAKGIVPFTVNGRQWQDGASAEHWAAFPNDSFAKLYETAKPIPGMVYWHNFRMHFPKDAVLVRTLSFANRRVETQLLHYDGIDWRPYTYAWREDQTDGDLVPAEGMEKELSVPGDSPGGNRRVWQFQSRTQCLICHNNQSEYALAFLPEQLNRRGSDGRNQLIGFTETGLVRRVGNNGQPMPAYDLNSVAKEKKLADPSDASQPLQSRARAYLHANCGHCHFEHGGGTVSLRLQFTVPNHEMKAVGVPPTRGDFGLPNAHIISPGSPWTSTLYYRMARFGKDRMPHIGAELPDEAGLKLIEEWITNLDPAKQTAMEIKGPWNQLLTEPRSAMVLARKLGRGIIEPVERNQLLKSVAELPNSPIRELFDGYLPQGDPTTRKLGSNPRPRSILGLSGNVERGEKLFWSESLKCGTCHKIGPRGTSVGPDLTTIGKMRTREDLLLSILEPSRRIEAKYAVYIAQLHDGRSQAGMLVRRDEERVVVRDGQNKEFHFAAKDVETLRPSRLSLMPENQLSGLAAQEAADLLEYLASRK